MLTSVFDFMYIKNIINIWNLLYFLFLKLFIMLLYLVL